MGYSPRGRKESDMTEQLILSLNAFSYYVRYNFKTKQKKLRKTKYIDNDVEKSESFYIAGGNIQGETIWKIA